MIKMADTNIQKLIDDVLAVQDSVSREDLDSNVANKLKPLKKAIERMQEMLKEDTDEFVELYNNKLSVFSPGKEDCESFLQILMLLEEDENAVYRPDEYKVISETEWINKREDKFHIWDIKFQDKKYAEKIDQKVERSFKKEMLCDQEKEKFGKELRIIISGYAGVGKSATGNLILGKQDCFNESYHASTKTVKEGERTEKNGRVIRVLDTPGLFGTGRSKEEIKLEFAKCYNLFKEGIHALVLVLNAAEPRSTEHMMTFAEAKKIFGKAAMKHCILVYTHFDERSDDTTVDTFLEPNDRKYKDILHNEISQRVMLLDNHASTEYERRQYRNNLISMVDKMVNTHKERIYENRVFIHAQKNSQEVSKTEKKNLQTVIQKKLQTFYEEALTMQIYMRTDSCSTMERISTGALDVIPKSYDDICKDLNGQISLLHKIPEVTKSIYEHFIKAEMTFSEKGDSPADDWFEDWKLQADEILLKNVSWLVDDQMSSQKICRKINAKRGCKAAISTRALSSYLQKILEGPMVENNQTAREFLEKSVGEENAQISNATNRVLMSHMFTQESIERLRKKKNTFLAKDIVKTVHEEMLVSENGMLTERELMELAEEHVGRRFASVEVISKTSVEGGCWDYVTECCEACCKSWCCFPSNCTVLAESGETYTMAELKIGDRVLTVNSSGVLEYEDIVFISHADHNSVTHQVCITSCDGDTISLSPSHLLYVENVNNLKPAREVKSGDTLLIYDSGTIQQKKVCEVTIKMENGLFCPHTRSGTLVVNHVLASCYTEHILPLLSHCLISSVGYLYHYLPTGMFQYIYGKDRINNTPKLFDTVQWLTSTAKGYLPGYYWLTSG